MEDTKELNKQEVYIPTHKETSVIDNVLNKFVTSRNIVQKGYSYFNGRNLYELIDDSEKRWNGYIPPSNILLDQYQSRIFINFTRNTVISYLAKVALQRPKIKVKAVNKKDNLLNQQVSDIFTDLIDFSHDAENAEARFLEAALEVTTKGTVVIYEGYSKMEQKLDVPDDFDAETGVISTNKETRILFDNCYQEVVPLEDFYISNPYESDVQKQPFVIWRQMTTWDEGARNFGHYKNWKYVKKGEYSLTSEPTTFYKNKLYSDLAENQIEILRYYERYNNKHIVLVNGVVMYKGVIPFKDGKYPFAKGIFEPFGNDFFWGSPLPNKILGDQDLINTLWNMMVDKTYGSLLPYGLSSDLDDLVEDNVLQPNKIRKVQDINKWKFDTLPGISSGEQSMLQMAMNFAQQNAGDPGGGAAGQTPKGGAITARQVLMKQQEAMQKLGFSVNFLEDLERDRTEIRLAHILQFYSIPKIEIITGKRGKEIEKMVYRDITLNDVTLSDGQKGTKVIKLIGDEAKNPDTRDQLADDLSVTEIQGEMNGTPTEALAISVNTFVDWNNEVQIVKNSSFERNEVLDQAVRHEYADWRLSLAQLAPVNVKELIAWVNESYNIDTDRFEPDQQMAPPVTAATPEQGQGNAPQQGGMPQPAQQMAPGKLGALSSIM